MQLELLVVNHQPGVGVERHQARIARACDQNVDLSAGMARPVAAGEVADNRRMKGDALVDRWQGARFHLVGEHRRFLHGGRRIGLYESRSQESGG